MWEKGGKVKWVFYRRSGVEPVTLLDISEKVASWADQGLMCVALDPDYAFNRYLYVAYAMDRYYLEHHQDSNYKPDSTVTKQATIGRIARYTINESFDQVIPDSEHVIIGKSFEDGVSPSQQTFMDLDQSYLVMMVLYFSQLVMEVTMKRMSPIKITSTQTKL